MRPYGNAAARRRDPPEWKELRRQIGRCIRDSHTRIQASKHQGGRWRGAGLQERLHPLVETRNSPRAPEISEDLEPPRDRA